MPIFTMIKRNVFANCPVVSLSNPCERKVRELGADSCGKAGIPAAFTIVEVLLVITIIALVASIGIGFVGGTYANFLVKRYASDFCIAARYARVLAIERQVPCRIEMDKENNKFALALEQSVVQAAQANVTAVKDFYFKPVTLPAVLKFESIRVTSNNLPADSLPDQSHDIGQAELTSSITFYPDGTAQSAVVQIGDGQNHYTVGISPFTGRVKMQRGTAENVQVVQASVDLDLMK